ANPIPLVEPIDAAARTGAPPGLPVMPPHPRAQDFCPGSRPAGWLGSGQFRRISWKESWKARRGRRTSRAQCLRADAISREILGRELVSGNEAEPSNQLAQPS